MKKQVLGDTFTSGQVARITRINYRTLDYWARTDFIVPSIAGASGTGRDRLYSFKDLIALCTARDLRAQGITTRALKRIVKQLRTAGASNQPLADSGFVVAGKDVFKVGTSHKELLSLIAHPNQTAFAFVFDMSKTTADLKAALENDTPVRKRSPRVKRAVVRKQAS